MADTPARGLAHLIGSVPLATTEEVLRTLAASLGDLLSRVPDGETGERRRWVWWQRTMLERHPAMEVDREAGLLELRQWDGSLLRRSELLRFKDGIDPDTVAFETGYAEAALASWRIFEGLRRDGVLADGVRFQVCLPTPMSSACMYVSPRSHDDYLRAFYLGLIHHADEAGDRRRIATARTVTPRFGVATECGWGRTDPARVSGLLESHRHAVEYLASAG